MMGYGYNNWWCGPGAFFPGPLGMIITLFFWGLIIFLAVKAVQALSRRQTQNEDSALTILRQRYANGEISQEEFERLRASLQG